MSTLLRDHPEALGPLETLADVVRYLREHQDSHRQWAVWLKQHPEDATAEVDSAEYQERSVERYERLIAVIEAASRPVAELPPYPHRFEAYYGDGDYRCTAVDVDDYNALRAIAESAQTAGEG